MRFLTEEYLLRRTEELTFIELKGGAQLNIEKYVVPKEGLDVPILTEELAENIKTKKENDILTIGAITRGIVYLLGIDSKFKHKEEYIKFLYATNPEIEKYILVQAANSLKENKVLNAGIHFKALLLLNPENEEALLNYALAILEYRDEELVGHKRTYGVFTKEVREKLEELSIINDKHPLAHYYLGFIYKDIKQYTKAKLYWEKALLLEIEDNLREQLKELIMELEDMVKYEQGYQAILSGRPQEGLPHLEEIEKKYPKWWNLLFFMGLGYRQIGEYPKAVEYFTEVLEIKKDQLDTLVELALCHGGLKEHDKAIECFEKALEVGGENSEILCNIAMIYLEMGMIEKARTHLNKSLELNPEDEITQECKKRLDHIEANTI
ncbi:MAG: tetratricopeptide repeat protein [Clostridiaceae bacterium]|nr:tetratricopeptide repeat protein [Clostridiaceae bacterium]